MYGFHSKDYELIEIQTYILLTFNNFDKEHRRHVDKILTKYVHFYKYISSEKIMLKINFMINNKEIDQDIVKIIRLYYYKKANNSKISQDEINILISEDKIFSYENEFITRSFFLDLLNNEQLKVFKKFSFQEILKVLQLSYNYYKVNKSNNEIYYRYHLRKMLFDCHLDIPRISLINKNNELDKMITNLKYMILDLKRKLIS